MEFFRLSWVSPLHGPSRERDRDRETCVKRKREIRQCPWPKLNEPESRNSRVVSLLTIDRGTSLGGKEEEREKRKGGQKNESFPKIKMRQEICQGGGKSLDWTRIVCAEAIIEATNLTLSAEAKGGGGSKKGIL